nr:MAG TPA: hypothetical protein [Caudoviricetes sp.]
MWITRALKSLRISCVFFAHSLRTFCAFFSGKRGMMVS